MRYQSFLECVEHVADWLRIGLMLFGLIVLVLFARVLWHVDGAIRLARPLPEHATQVTTQATLLLAHLDERLNGIGAPKAQNSAVLPALTQAIRDVRQTAVDANWASKQYYVDLKTRTDDLSDRFRDQVFGERGTVNRLNAGITELSADGHTVMLDTSTVLRQLDVDMVALAKVIGDPDLTDTIHHLDVTAGNMEQTTASLALLMADVQGKVHEVVHPSKKQRALSGLLNLVKLSYYLSQLR